MYSFDQVFISAESYLSIIEDSKYFPLVRMLDGMNEGDELLTAMQMTGLWVMYQSRFCDGWILEKNRQSRQRRTFHSWTNGWKKRPMPLW